MAKPTETTKWPEIISEEDRKSLAERPFDRSVYEQEWPKITCKFSPRCYFTPYRQDFERFVEDNNVSRRDAIFVSGNEQAYGLDAHNLNKVVCYGERVDRYVLESRGFRFHD